jgi:serine/threonine protein kinase
MEMSAIPSACERPDAYAEIARQFGATTQARGPWAVVCKSPRRAGWKLHLTSIPTNAPALLERISPLLLARGIPFKFVRDAEHLRRLNDGEYGPQQIGKAVTIYPESDALSAALARELVDLTGDLVGPVVRTDWHVGAVVYARYGGFEPYIRVDRLGIPRLMLQVPTGEFIEDEYTIPHTPPEWAGDPFEGSARPSPELATDIRGNSLFGPGYLLTELIHARPWGGTYLGLDLQRRETARVVVLKQGFRHHRSDGLGRDARARLAHQAVVHHALAAGDRVPAAGEYFEVAGHGYLAVDFLHGRSIETVAHELLGGGSWAGMSADGRIRCLTILADLVAAVGEIHARGYLHRDISANNVWICDDDRVRLLDLELAHPIGSDQPPFGAGTPGFMSPQQQAGDRPQPADDIHALGAAMVLALTGIDPRRLLSSNSAELRVRLSATMGCDEGPLLDAIVAALDESAERRPTIATLQDVLASSIARARVSARGSRRRPEAIADAAARAVALGLAGLSNAVALDASTGLWATTEIRGRTIPDHAVGKVVARDANKGIAGPLYAIARLAQMGFEAGPTTGRARDVAAWLATQPRMDPLPGLHFGEAGVALALLEAQHAGLWSTPDSSPIVRRLEGAIDWPDLTHGAAGQGLACVAAEQLLPGLDLSSQRNAAVEHLLETQMPDGSWIMPAGVSGMSGEALTGFAHGAAGIAHFLLDHFQRCGDAEAARAAEQAFAWLDGLAIPIGEALGWPYGSKHPEPWKWWCHGSPGIALAYAKWFQCSKDPSAAQTARRALAIHPRDVRVGNLGVCHGLAGLGEIYLDVWRMLGDDEWYDRALAIADVLAALGQRTASGSLTWTVENPYVPTADLMVGCAGILHFLGQVASGVYLGFPLMPRPD